MSSIILEQRELGRVVGEVAGPTLIAVGGIHGNEHAGIHAARRVFARLADTTQKPIKVMGDMIAFAGNVAAARKKQRYHERDLNRVWTDAKVEAVHAKAAADRDHEDVEQVELHAAIKDAIARARGPVFLVDCHTTSAPGVPFVLFGETEAQRLFVQSMGMPLPHLRGLEEQLEGVLSAYWAHHGIVTFAVEGGQHDDPATVDNLESVLWIAMEAAGLLKQDRVAEVTRSRAYLDEKRGELPRLMEVVRRHAIVPEDAFKMEPGFRNLHKAPAGTLLAHDKNGEIRADTDGVLMLPLYQGQGNDGFFWGREVNLESLSAPRISEPRLT